MNPLRQKEVIRFLESIPSTVGTLPKGQSTLKRSQCASDNNPANGLTGCDAQRFVRSDGVQGCCAARRTDILPVVTEPEDVNQRWRERVTVFNCVSLPIYKS